MPGGVIVSETEPERSNRYYWFKPSNRKWYELNPTLTAWEEKFDEAPLITQEQLDALVNVYAAVAHTHTTFGDISFTGSISVDGSAGITGSKTLGGYTITFKKGILTGFNPV